MSDLPDRVQPLPEHLDPMPIDTLPVDTPLVFAELVCADPGLLRAEFEALIAANYPPGDGHGRRRPPRRPGLLRIERARPAPPAVFSLRSGTGSGSGGRAGTERAARERGPP